MGGLIGIDFDNTIVRYDGLFHDLARERNLIPSGTPRTKTAVRDAIRSEPDGELAWQRLQALVYGPEINRAAPAKGVREFLIRCRGEGLIVHVVSHKTRLAAQDSDGVDLRQAALGWLQEHGFFDPRTSPLRPDRVWFAETRQEKLDIIMRLFCQYFIDDLPELFTDPAFPDQSVKVLYDPEDEHGPIAGVIKAIGFEEVGRIVC